TPVGFPNRKAVRLYEPIHANIRRSGAAGLGRIVVMNGRVARLSPMMAFALLGASVPTYAHSCEDIGSLKLPNTTIESAAEMPADQFSVPPGPGANMQSPPQSLERTAPTKLPAFCRVRITIAPAIRIEVWMPASGWNGNFEGVGNGGKAGSISYPAMAT